MNAARRRISGDGEFEKEWKRLFGISNGLPSASGAGVDWRPPGLRYSGGSFLTVCPWPKVKADRLPREFSGSFSFDCVPFGRFDSLGCRVEIVLRPEAVSLVEGEGHCGVRDEFLRVFRHLWQV